MYTHKYLKSKEIFVTKFALQITILVQFECQELYIR